MPRVVSSTEFTRQTRKLMDHARVEKEPVIVEYYGTPHVVIISYETYQKLERLLKVEQLARLNRDLNREAAQLGITEEELFKTAHQIREELYRERYG